MIYFANPSTEPSVLEAMATRKLGVIDTPKQGNRYPAEADFCLDNGCFNARTYTGDDAWLKWLAGHKGDKALCRFVTAPDVVGDAEATLKRSRPFLPQIRALGFPAALVAQDGLELLEVPWGEFDCLFIGGSTEWKLGPEAAVLVKEAKAQGKWVHMGRVNSKKRFKYAESIGCDSADGTFLVFGPKVNLPRLLRWFE